MLKTAKTQIHARRRHFSSLGMNYAAKTFHALKRRFSQKYDYCRGFALVGMKRCCTSNARVSATTWWRVLEFWHKTQGVEVWFFAISLASLLLRLKTEIQLQCQYVSAAPSHTLGTQPNKLYITWQMWAFWGYSTSRRAIAWMSAAITSHDGVQGKNTITWCGSWGQG